MGNLQSFLCLSGVRSKSPDVGSCIARQLSPIPSLRHLKPKRASRDTLQDICVAVVAGNYTSLDVSILPAELNQRVVDLLCDLGGGPLTDLPLRDVAAGYCAWLAHCASSDSAARRLQHPLEPCPHNPSVHPPTPGISSRSWCAGQCFTTVRCCCCCASAAQVRCSRSCCRVCVCPGCMGCAWRTTPAAVMPGWQQRGAATTS
jgi:hypothetical protein